MYDKFFADQVKVVLLDSIQMVTLDEKGRILNSSTHDSASQAIAAQVNPQLDYKLLV